MNASNSTTRNRSSPSALQVGLDPASTAATAERLFRASMVEDELLGNLPNINESHGGTTRHTTGTLSSSSSNPFADAPHDENRSMVMSLVSQEDSSSADGGRTDASLRNISPSLMSDQGSFYDHDYRPPPPSQVDAVPSRVESSMSTTRSDDHLELLEAMDDATMVLHERFNQQYMIQSLKQYFVCWSQGPLNHLTWSASFIHPISAEIFLAGSLIRNPPEVYHFGTCFYSTKKWAIKAAAGRAEDCFRLRESRRGTRIAQFTSDRPYEEGRDAGATTAGALPIHEDLLSHVPPAARIQIERKRTEILARGAPQE